MIAIIDYNAGNVASVANALRKLGQDFVITSNAGELERADKIIFPGVGRAGAAMAELKRLGLISILREAQVPFLGICLGMQLMLDFSYEDEVSCLGIVPGNVRRFHGGENFLEKFCFDNGKVRSEKNAESFVGENLTSERRALLKIPQVGWNSVKIFRDDPLFQGIADECYFYFVNSFYADPGQEFIIGKSLYGDEFASVIRKNNFWGVQFHPEKSGEAGLKLLSNFCNFNKFLC